jgi:acid stress-induced BolA-like protein IbaG/YrbA
MALEKQVVVDKVEVTGDFRHVQIRTATRIVEDGNVISSSYHRHVVAPGQDYSAEDAEVQAVCAAVHTPEIVAAYQAHLASQGV